MKKLLAKKVARVMKVSTEILLTVIVEKAAKTAKVSTEIELMIIVEKVAKVTEVRMRLTMIVEEEAMDTEKSVLVKVEETGGHLVMTEVDVEVQEELVAHQGTAVGAAL